MLGTETAAFIAGRVSLIAAVSDAALQPRAMRAWGVRVVSADDALLRVVLDAADAEAVDEALTRGGRIALTGTDVHTLEASQVKGRIRGLEEADEGDWALLERYCREVFADISDTDDIPLELLHRTRPDDLVACRFTVDQVFDQTPGPGAGASLGEPR